MRACSSASCACTLLGACSRLRSINNETRITAYSPPASTHPTHAPNDTLRMLASRLAAKRPHPIPMTLPQIHWRIGGRRPSQRLATQAAISHRKVPGNAHASAVPVCMSHPCQPWNCIGTKRLAIITLSVTRSTARNTTPALQASNNGTVAADGGALATMRGDDASEACICTETLIRAFSPALRTLPATM